MVMVQSCYIVLIEVCSRIRRYSKSLGLHVTSVGSLMKDFGNGAVWVLRLRRGALEGQELSGLRVRDLYSEASLL